MEPGREASSDSAAVVSRPVAADWLELRRAADHQARTSTLDLMDSVTTWLREHLAADQAAVIIDLGAGSGSNQAWMAPHLNVPQKWILVDHDADLLNLSTATPSPQVQSTQRLMGSVEQLPELIPAEAPVVITCAALLDLLRPQEAALIVETISSSQAAAVLSLSVTGSVHLTPADPMDQRIAAAFDAHQRREDLLGPGAAEVVATQLEARGVAVEIVQTDWVLDDAQPEFVARYLSDRVQAATEHDSALAEDAAQWLQRRLRQLHRGELTLRVGHRDVVSLPASSAAATA